VRHSQDLGKRARLERAAASSIKKLRRRSQLRRLRELQDKGSMSVGPSEDYKMLLRGEISSEEYVKRLKETVDKRFK